MNRRLVFVICVIASLMFGAGLLFTAPSRFFVLTMGGREIAPCNSVYDYVLRTSHTSGEELARHLAEQIAARYPRYDPAASWQPAVSAQPLPASYGGAGQIFRVALGPAPDNFIEVHTVYPYLSPAAGYISVQAMPLWALLAADEADPRVYVMLWREGAHSHFATDGQAQAVRRILESLGAGACWAE